MTTEQDTRVSSEINQLITELDEAMLGRPGDNWWRDCSTIKQRLQPLRSSTPVEEAKPVVTDEMALLDLIREEAFKDNSPLGRSDSIALYRIRAALDQSPTKGAE